MISLDVHVIISNDTSKSWVEQCIDSINVAISNAKYKINLFTVDGIENHIGKARNIGFSLGNSEYATYVDDDDYILPNAFSILEQPLLTAPDAIFTKELTLQNGKFREGLQRHHLAVYKRNLLIDYADWPCFDSMAQRAAVHGMNIIDIPEPVYVHRIYPTSKARKLRKQYKDLLTDELWEKANR